MDAAGRQIEIFTPFSEAYELMKKILFRHRHEQLHHEAERSCSENESRSVSSKAVPTPLPKPWNNADLRQRCVSARRSGKRQRPASQRSQLTAQDVLHQKMANQSPAPRERNDGNAPRE